MKKLMLIEIALLAVLLLAAVWVTAGLGDSADPTAPTDPTTNITDPATPATDPTVPTVPTDPTTGVTEPTAPTLPDDFVPTWNTYPEDRKLLAQQYFVYDTGLNRFLVTSGQENERVELASITKLFTAYVALQYLEPDQRIKVDDVLELVPAGSSVANLQQGDVLTVERLVEAMLLPSGNDAAYVLACAAGRAIRNKPDMWGSYAVAAFVSEMNTQAKAIGMTGTHFVNPDGIHSDNHYSTFADLVIMGKLAMANETVMKYAATPKDRIYLHGVFLDWKNTNILINPESDYYCPYAVGLKTGQTPYAGACLLSAFRIHGRELIIGVFGCPKERDRFDDTLHLFNQIVLN